VNIAVPQLTTSPGATLDQVLWIVNAYTLAYASLLIAGGRFGDLLGPKRLFMLGLALFTVASAACGLAQTPTQLIATRALQGIGGAMLTPQTLAFITILYPVPRRGAAFGIWGAVAGLATVTGPVFGGWLVTALDWRWIFYVNVPIGVATLILARFILPAPRFTNGRPVDWLSTLLTSLALVAVCFGLIEGPLRGGNGVILIAGVTLLALFLWRHRRGLLADRDFAVMSGVVAAISFGMLGLFLPLVIFLQSVLSLSALQAGLILAPMSLASVATAPFAGRLADRYAGRDVLVAGLVMWAGGIGLVLWATRLYYDRRQLITDLTVAGLGLGMTFAPLQSIAMRNVRPAVASAAAGLMNTARQIGAVLGSAAVGALLQAQIARHLPASARANADALPMGFRGRFLEAFDHASAGGTGRGLAVGVGQTGHPLPASIPESVRPAIEQVALKTFYEAYIPAMRVHQV
jgi:EmrB/QacA subfamily drug resistance transporter